MTDTTWERSLRVGDRRTTPQLVGTDDGNTRTSHRVKGQYTTYPSTNPESTQGSRVVVAVVCHPQDTNNLPVYHTPFLPPPATHLL